MRHRRQARRKPRIGFSLTTLIVLIVLIRAFMAFPHAKLGKVTKGMTMGEISELVGLPTEVEQHYDETFWDYTKPLSFGRGGVTFDTNGLVIEVQIADFP